MILEQLTGGFLIILQLLLPDLFLQLVCCCLLLTAFRFLIRRWGHPLHFAVRHFFDHVQMCDFPWRNKRNSFPGSACSAGTSDPVYIVFGVLRDIEVVNVRHTGNMQSPRCYIRSEQYINTIIFKFAKNGNPLPLRNVSVNPFCTDAASLKSLRTYIHT